MRTQPRRRLLFRFALAAAVLAAISIGLEVRRLVRAESDAALWADDAATRDRFARELPVIPRNDRRVLLMMIDGLAVHAFESALAEGAMPALARLLRSRPTVSMHALSTFPSATSPSVPELMSGRYANGSIASVPAAVHAFDREEKRVVRYVTQPDAWQWPLPTLFDATRGRTAVTVFEGRWDGPTAILTQVNLAGRAALELIGAQDLSPGDSGPVAEYIEKVRGKHPPSVSLVVLNEFDLIAHFSGPDSARAREALAETDRHIGEIVDALAASPGGHGRSQLDETTLVLFGDHGMVPSGNFVDLPAHLSALGLTSIDVSTVAHLILRERLGTLWTDSPDVIMVSGGSNIAQVYLRSANGGWSDSDAGAQPRRAYPPIEELARSIPRLRGVSQVMWPDGGRGVRIVDANGLRARVLQDTGDVPRYAYVVADADTADPFGYLALPQVAGLVCRESRLRGNCFHTRTEWFDASIEARFPGAPALINKAFHPRRYTGDLTVTLLPGYSFIRDQHGDHGNLEREAMLAPLVLNGPGVTPRAEAHRPRLVDIYPTTAVLLGASPDDPAFRLLDGRVLDSVRP